MGVLKGYVKVLASAPRGAGSEGELRAALYVAGVLKDLGYSPRVEIFDTVPSFSYTYIIVFTMLALAPIISFLNPITGAVLSIIGFILLIAEEEFYILIITRFLAKIFGAKSYNVIVEKGSGKLVAVLMAHIDSTKAAYSFHPSRVRYLRVTILVNFISSTVITILTILSIPIGFLAYIAALSSIPLWLTIAILIHRELFHSYVPGANDNASGVAALLGFAEKFKSEELPGRIAMVFTGSEEVGMLGSYHVYKNLRREVMRAAIINIDNPGIGEIVFTDCEGVIFRWCTDKEFRRTLEKVASKLDIRIKNYRILPTDATPAIRKELKATSIMAFVDNMIANYHWYTDTADKVSEENLEKAVKITYELIKTIANQG